jgi:hypothetical protein
MIARGLVTTLALPSGARAETTTATRHSLSRLLVTLVVAVVAAAVLPASARAADTLRFGDEGASASFGANAIVRIDGTITYASDCPEPGIDDFFFPATDVYVVRGSVKTLGGEATREAATPRGSHGHAPMEEHDRREDARLSACSCSPRSAFASWPLEL